MDMEKLLELALKQLDTAVQFKRARTDDIRENEDIYLGKTKKALKGRFNVPLDSTILHGFVNTLLAKIDDPPSLRFKHTDDKDIMTAKKLTSAWEQDSAEDRKDWAQKDRWVKRQVALGGRGVFAYDMVSRELRCVDYHDFFCDPYGGSDLENHLFAGEMNVWKTSYQLKEGDYDKKQVQKLLSGETDERRPEEEQDKAARMEALGMSPQSYSFAGTPSFSLVQQVLQWKGDRWYILYDKKARIWVRAVKLKEITESDLMPFVSWAYDDDPFNFWSRGPVDVIKPVAEAMKVTFNQMLENVQKRNWDMKAYDPDMISDPSQLEYRPDGLIAANRRTGEPMQNGIMQIQVPDVTSITINLVDYLNRFLGEKTGITPGAQGLASEKRVGIYYGDLQQVMDRMGLLNKTYVKAWVSLGKRFDWSLYENMKEEMMVKLIGSGGVGWEKLVKNDLEPDFTCHVFDFGAEERAKAEKMRKKQESLAAIGADPTLIAVTNPAWRVRQLLKVGEWSEEDVVEAMDLNSLGRDEVQANAGKAIDALIHKKLPQLFHNADTYFMQKLLDYESNNDLDEDTRARFHAYMYAMMPVVRENMARKIFFMQSPPVPGAPGGISREGMPAVSQPGVPPVPAPPTAPAQSPATRNGAIGQGVRLTSRAKGQSRTP